MKFEIPDYQIVKSKQKTKNTASYYYAKKKSNMPARYWTSAV